MAPNPSMQVEAAPNPSVHAGAAPNPIVQAGAAPNPSVQAAVAAAPAGSRPGKGSKAAAAPSFRDLARRGDYKGAYDALGASGIRRESMGDGVDTLLLLADIARLSGHPEEAAAPLARIVARRPNDPRTPLAAFTLGRLELDTLGQPARAARSFKAALALGLSEPLVEDARARLVEALARAGDLEGARAAAAEYERRSPDGQRLKDVRRWIGGH
jgi:transmembrane sensor